jgi:hypothetical protein
LLYGKLHRLKVPWIHTPAVQAGQATRTEHVRAVACVVYEQAVGDRPDLKFIGDTVCCVHPALESEGSIAVVQALQPWPAFIWLSNIHL